MEAGVTKRSIKLQYPSRSEAEMFMAAVHGAMLSARAPGKTEVSRSMTATALQRLSKTKRQKK
jgi:TetR/AcrR family transcriptional repressor of nem operon